MQCIKSSSENTEMIKKENGKKAGLEKLCITGKVFLDKLNFLWYNAVKEYERSY